MITDNEIRDYLKPLEKLVPSQKTIDDTHALVEEYIKNKSVQDDFITIGKSDHVYISKRNNKRAYRNVAVIAAVMIISAIIAFGIYKEDIIKYFSREITPTSTPTPTPTVTPDVKDGTEKTVVYSNGTTSLVCIAEITDAPIVKLRFTLYDENDNPVEGTEELTLWISKGNYDRKTYDGIEWCRTYYVGLIGASDDYNDMLKTVAPGTQEPISIWYLTTSGKWVKWPLTFIGLTKNVYNLKFIVEKKNTIDICYVHLLDHNEEVVLESEFPIRDEEYWGIESILNTKYSDNPSRYETGGVDIEPYMTLWQDYYGNIVYYNPYINSEFIVDYYRKDKYGNNIMLVKRFSPHVMGIESMYFAAFDDEYKLVGKYHFEENDESHFKEFEYEGERYFAYAGESFGQGYRCCKFKIYSFRDNKWQDLVSWSHELKAVLNENGIDVYRIDIYNSGGEPTYLCTYTYQQLLNGVELPY